MEGCTRGLNTGGVVRRSVLRSLEFGGGLGPIVSGEEGAVEWQVAIHPETEIVTSGIRDRFLLARQEGGVNGSEVVMVEVTAEVKTLHCVGGPQIEKLGIGSALLIRAVDRARPAA